MVMVSYAQLVVSVSLVFYISWLNRDRKKHAYPVDNHHNIG
jgi:hypothetical protein